MKNFLHSKRFQSLLLLWGLLAASSLVIFRYFLFGDLLVVFNDAGSDTRQQYLMQYATIVNHLKTGNYSLWDLNNGFGASMFSLNMSNIFLMLVYLAGYLFGIGRIPGVIVYLLLLQIILAGTFCFLFLDNFSLSNRSKVISSYIYGLCGYLLIWGQHYQFGSFVVFLPLLLHLLERAIRRKKFSLSVPFVTAAMVCASVYMSYMALIMAGCYILYRMVLCDDTGRKRIHAFILHCSSLVLGIGIGAFIFLPMAYYLMTNSSRLESSVPFLQRIAGYLSLYDSDFYETAFLRMFSSLSQGLSDYSGYSNFYEAPVLFFGVLFLIVAFQYVFTIHKQKASVKSKCLQYTAIAFFVFCMFIRLGAAAFNAFAYPFARHSFIFMPLFALVTAYTLDQILIRKQLSIPALALSALYITAAGIISLDKLTQNTLKAVMLLSLLLGWAMIILLVIAARGRAKNKSLFRNGQVIAAMLLACVALNMTAEGYYCYNGREVLTRSAPYYWAGLYNPNVAEAVSYLKENDPDLFRAEKDYAAGSYCMDAMAQGYRGISAYNSTPNSNLEEFVNCVIPNFPLMARYEYTYRQIGYYTGHSTLFGIKYLLSQIPDLQLDGFTLLKQFGDIYVYKNENVSSFARFYTKTADSSILKNAYGKLDLEQMLLETLFLDDPQEDARSNTAKYSLEKIPVHIPNIKADGSSDSVTIPLDQEALNGYERVYLEFDIKLSDSGDVCVNPDQPLPYYFRLSAGRTQHVQIAVPKSYDRVTLQSVGGSLKGKIRKIRLLGSRSTVPAQTQSTVTMPDTANDSVLSGTVNAAQDGYLFLPVPYENGWSAVVDGKETPILRADIGFMSIPVSEGEHSFTFTYRQPYMQAGIYISIVSLIIWSILCMVRIYKKKKSNSEN